MEKINKSIKLKKKKKTRKEESFHFLPIWDSETLQFNP